MNCRSYEFKITCSRRRRLCVKLAHFVEPTSIPFPATRDWIDHGCENESKENKLSELDAFGYESGHDRGCCSGEGSLEQEVDGWNEIVALNYFSCDRRVEEEAKRTSLAEGQNPWNDF